MLKLFFRIVTMIFVCGTLVATDRAVIIAVSSFGKTTWADLPNQARQLERQLQSQGFETISKIDPDRRGLTELIQTIEDRSGAGDRVAFFYLGLALSGRGTGYLLPAGTLIKGISDLDFEGVNVERFLGGLSEKKVPAALFVDGNRSLSGAFFPEIKVGLVQSAGVPGTVIFTAGGEGEIFDDQPFLSSLRTNLDLPNLEINQLMMAVRKEVSTQSKGALVPLVSTSLMTEWYFNPKSTRKAFTGDVFELKLTGPQEGLEVFVDDVKLGLTPFNTFLSSGTHQLRIEGSAWEPWTGSVEGTRGDVKTVSASPQPNRYLKMLQLTNEKDGLLGQRNDLYTASYWERAMLSVILCGEIVGYVWGGEMTVFNYLWSPDGQGGYHRDEMGLQGFAWLALGGVSTWARLAISPPLQRIDTIEARLRAIDADLKILG